jgi:predicted enzyme related to lactoylglutathione lyase
MREIPAVICYMEIPAPDIERAGAFYSKVFGWHVKASNLSTQIYWEFNTGEGQLTGGLVSF